MMNKLPYYRVSFCNGVQLYTMHKVHQLNTYALSEIAQLRKQYKFYTLFLGIPYYITGVAAPILGFVIDRAGRNIAFVMAACMVTMIAHILLLLQSSQFTAYVAMSLMGIGYSTFASSLWPIISLISPHHHQGTAFGIILI